MAPTQQADVQLEALESLAALASFAPGRAALIEGGATQRLARALAADGGWLPAGSPLADKARALHEALSPPPLREWRRARDQAAVAAAAAGAGSGGGGSGGDSGSVK